MAMLPTQLETGEDYGSTADILACDDRPQATIRVPQWRKNGQPIAIRVQALSLAQRETVAAASLRNDGTTDVVAQMETTLREGVLLPRFDDATAGLLRNKNGQVLEQIASFIWALSSLDQEYIDAVVQQLSDARPRSAAADDPPDSPDLQPAQPVAGSAERPLQPTARRTGAHPKRTTGA